MNRSNIVIGVLIVIIIFVCTITAVGYNKNIKLTSEINKLNAKVTELDAARNSLLEERENLRTELNTTQSKMKMLEEDVTKIYKSCIINNICKGRYPGIRWKCNNVGDQADENTASHICECDASCQLNATEIQRS